ncbi:WD40 repeat domain-containing protein [Archangium sp.]|uniref:WD40 repeat domain-containing protein n=1 Tax=Archangium sp. TaxID=1872627 RepID=UPI00389B2A63
MTDELHSLTDLHTLEQLARTQGLDALDAALGEALARVPEEARVTLDGGPTVSPRTLRMIRSALALDAGFLRAHPEALFQCLFNRLRWFDAPDAEAFFTPTEHAPWSAADAHLHALAEHWRRQRDARNPAPWLEALRPLRGGLESREQLFRGHEAQVLCAAFSPSGERLATGAWDDEDNLRIWDVATGECTQVLQGHECEILDVAWSPDGKLLATGSRDHDVRLWDAATGALLHELTGQEGRVTSVAFSPNGRIVAAGNLGWRVRLLEVSSGEVLRELQGHEQSVLSVAFHPSGRYLATGASDDTARIWNVETGEQVALIEAEREVASLAFSPDGAWLALTVDEGIALVETQGWTRVRTVGGEGPYSQVAWLGNETLGALSYDRLVVLDARSGEISRSRPQESDGNERRVAFHPDGRRFAITAADGVVRMSDLASEPPPEPLSELARVDELWASPEAGLAVIPSSIFAFVLDGRGQVRQMRPEPYAAPGQPWVASPDGKLLAYPANHYEEGGMRALVVLLDVETLAPVRTLSAEPGPSEDGERSEPDARLVAFSPDGTSVAAVVEEGAVRLWRLADGALLHTLRGHEDAISLLRFTPDGAYLVSGSASSSRLLLHDTKSGAIAVDTRALLEPVVAYAAASRAPRICVGRRSGEVEIFELATASRRLVRVTEGAVVGVDLSPDGALAAACCDDGAVRLVDTRTGSILHELQHPALPFRVAFGDGVVITKANDEHGRFFSLSTGALLAEIPGHVEPDEAVHQEDWVVLGEDALALHRRQEPTPRIFFQDPMEQAFILRGGLVVGRGRSERDALYVLRIHGQG